MFKYRQYSIIEECNQKRVHISTVYINQHPICVCYFDDVSYLVKTFDYIWHLKQRFNEIDGILFQYFEQNHARKLKS